ncbi:C-type lectin domain family 4 member K isoform X1 [Anolis carolinensis]|uniref:C-type lectin domain family 4 member K isoform X1 n=1 Tax=Anolis carolinensis TaxID=28377 RepID=UPI002F2B7586
MRMASWKGLYVNVEAHEHGIEEPRNHEPKSQPAGIKEQPEEDSLYEAVDPATRLEAKQREPVPPTSSPARTPTCSRKVILLTGAALLAISMFLNVLLLTMGTVHYSKMGDTLEQVRNENKRLQETVSSSFLLYNENKNVCATNGEENYLTAVSCSSDVRAQHFQLLFSGLLRHVASGLCVAAQERRSRKALLLKPCKPQSSLQHWTCRDHDLLALKGSDLYFNYGNSVRQRVILFDGSGPWSRWLIYGTHSSICNSCTPLGRDWNAFQESYYFFSHTPGSWDVANQSCTSMGSHLLTINSAEEKDYVANVMKITSYWIGLTDQELEGDWKWVDGTKAEREKSYWHSSEPGGGKSENCAMVSHALWYDCPCKERYHWICKRRIRPMT